MVQVLLGDCSNSDLTQQAEGVVEAVLQGRNSAVVALGQAGSGKSHTMFGFSPQDPEAAKMTGQDPCVWCQSVKFCGLACVIVCMACVSKGVQ